MALIKQTIAAVLCGAFLNVLLTWTLAATDPLPKDRSVYQKVISGHKVFSLYTKYRGTYVCYISVAEDTSKAPLAERNSVPSEVISALVDDGILPRELEGALSSCETSSIDGQGKRFYLRLTAYGWPSLSMWSQGRYDAGSAAPLGSAISLGGVPIRTQSNTTLGYRALPLNVLFYGTLRNIALFSIAMYILLRLKWLQGLIRRSRRRAEGLCETCGYPRCRETIRCSECGSAYRNSID